MIRPALPQEANQIANIYNHYVRDTVVTFEETEVSAQEMASRMDHVAACGLPWLVAEHDLGIIGYAYATPWHARSAYRHTVEVTVYLENNAVSKGWGSKLYESLFAELRQKPIEVVIGCLTLPNAASVALHEKFGMKKVGHFESVGYKFGRWLDVGYWHRCLNGSTDHD